MALLTVSAIPLVAAAQKGVQVTPDAAQRRVDITIDGKPFTSYIWPTSLKKPVLYPLLDADGVTVTRGCPLEPRPGERADHPHHAGLWFNYGNVNGFDFWNNSDAIKPAQRSEDGHHRLQQNRLQQERPDQRRARRRVQPGLTAITTPSSPTPHATSSPARDQRAAIDQIVTLKALDHVVFHDDKDGLLGIRVARWLESPEEKGGTFTDSNGVATPVTAAANTPGVAPPTGEYFTSEGVKGTAVWSTRARWCALTGHDASGHTVTIAIFDHPGNVGYPTYWHARGYGLFAANPLGRHMFDPKQAPLDFTLDQGETVTFRYRVVIYTGTPSPSALNQQSENFAASCGRR